MTTTETKGVSRYMEYRRDAQAIFGDDDHVFRVNWEPDTDTLRISRDGGGVVHVNPDGSVQVDGGPDGSGELAFGNARLYEDANGDVVVEDGDGNTTILS